MEHETKMMPGHPDYSLYERSIYTFVGFLSFNNGMTTET